MAAFRRISGFCILLSLFLTLITCDALARPMSKDQAAQAARGWLRRNPAPMGAPIRGVPADLRIVLDEAGQPLYYVGNLRTQGFVILSADDAIEPVIAFSPTGCYETDEDSPLKTLLNEDMKGRRQAVAQKHDDAAQIDDVPQHQRRRDRVSQQWDELFVAAESAVGIESIPSVSDIRVPPLLQTQWDQSSAAGDYCYNYYTPSHHPAGCVATAMAQLMRYHQWPVAGIGYHGFTISVNGIATTAYTRGGDGFGGPYNWTLMPLIPAAGLTLAERQAIGALCYDAGVAVNMSYAAGGSSASTTDADAELVNTFLYSNSIHGIGFPGSGNNALWTMINSNLDAALPVILSIRSAAEGHAVIADGYGYNAGTAYHHINMGWSGQDDTWYQLPLIDAYYTYTTIDSCIYNVYTSGTGEIVSGRVTSMGGAPLANAVVTAWSGSTPVRSAATNSRGIYALKNLASNSTYRLSVSLSGFIFTDQYVTTGRSQDWGSASGNKWGIDLASTNASPPIAQDISVTIRSTDPNLITLLAPDDGLPDPNVFFYTITSLPAHGKISEPNVGPIDSVPYSMAYRQNQVLYTPCPCYGGPDTFTYTANDGGTPPTGGQSNTATVTVNVDDTLNFDYGTSSNSPLTGSLMLATGTMYDARTEIILLQSEIGAARNITDLAIRVNTAPGRTLSNWTIRMQHTTWTQFSNPNSMIPATGWTTVYQADTTVGSGWVNFHFQQPFAYNGTQNLLIDMSYNNAGLTDPDGTFYVLQAAVDRVLSLGSKTGAHGDPLTWSDWYGKYYSVNSYIPSMKILGNISAAPITGDIDRSCRVGLPDFAVMARAWQTTLGDANYNPGCDLAANNSIDMNDLAVLAAHWTDIYPGF